MPKTITFDTAPNSPAFQYKSPARNPRSTDWADLPAYLNKVAQHEIAQHAAQVIDRAGRFKRWIEQAPNTCEKTRREVAYRHWLGQVGRGSVRSALRQPSKIREGVLQNVVGITRQT
jgi:hypothetical protein